MYGTHAGSPTQSGESALERWTGLSRVKVKLNRGLDFINLDDILVDLKLSPEVVEIPIPRYFLEDRSKVYQNSLLASWCLL